MGWVRSECDCLDAEIFADRADECGVAQSAASKSTSYWVGNAVDVGADCRDDDGDPEGAADANGGVSVGIDEITQQDVGVESSDVRKKTVGDHCAVERT